MPFWKRERGGGGGQQSLLFTQLKVRPGCLRQYPSKFSLLLHCMKPINLQHFGYEDAGTNDIINSVIKNLSEAAIV